MERDAFPIGGFQPTSLIDYPDRVAAVVFTAGCSLRCPFCHNPDLVLPDRVAALPLTEPAEVLETLRERSGFLDGVVITGGEPTMHSGLAAFARDVKALGLLVKLDTNGTAPARLAELLQERLIDFVAMDVKAPRLSYGRLAGRDVDLDAIERSIALIRDRAPDYEFRTTAAPTLDAEEINEIAAWIAGAKRFVLQTFRVPEGSALVDAAWNDRSALSADELREIWGGLSDRFDTGGVRG